MKNKNEIDNHRRRAIKALGGTVVAGAVLSTASASAKTSPVKVETEKSEDEKGYRETQHIRDYYDSL
ncbi:hypothetical protein A9264_06945 [Vibrio sp. UCD-FRSSP16_10]|uniref:hypothetical protein n=1 Tax=unclassified Vibrio TaxID=2614977 RepID=UPI0007FC9E8C|nr:MULTISPECIES: hypothetical protein [unclassified Vibrio]OBT13399.1 hypothetical protein A9264_06945 [Vibrio sp. UCD-FRSSP16_10]OBT17909.1 hypothetical protein A9260_00935 [Vibrio sp. UCD-FRSSP16_30]